jgi:putative ATPase
MDLFSHRAAKAIREEAPLAARMRPRTLDEYIGQRHIMAPGRLLRRAIEADRLSSLIFYGPPGTGKTTLAEVIARRTSAHFHAINAVLAGVKDIREAIEQAQQRRGERGQGTVLFVDEVHRFNKAQQDALLPWVENGTVILVGATTENPYFEVNKALVSRSRLFQLRPLDAEELGEVLDAALKDGERGYGALEVVLKADARAHLINIANGDARALLGALELAVETTPPDHKGRVLISLAVAEESIQRRAVLYDKEGDAHFDIISAFIKSLRGSDPDAALYWLARMVYAGEDPRFLLRRLLIFASEDVGLACPEAVSVVHACAQSFDRVGMPEGRFPLAQATLYLATAPKSNSTMGFFDALAAVQQEREGEVPNHLKDASRDGEGFGHGKGYLYPHAWRDHWVAQQYLPEGLQGRLFYQPSDQGHEARLHDEVHRRRDAQLAAMMEREVQSAALTTGPREPALERWLQRTLGDVGAQLGAQRDRLFDAARVARHHLILDLLAGTGLLTWEAVRRAPEGGVWARCASADEAQALLRRADALDPLRRPVPFACALEALDAALDPALRFDAILGRAALAAPADRPALLRALAARLLPGGALALWEPVARLAQRLSALLPEGAAPPPLLARWREAEDALYADPTDPLLGWDEEAMRAALQTTGLIVTVELHRWRGQRRVSPEQHARWFPPTSVNTAQTAGLRDYLGRLRAQGLTPDEAAQIAALTARHLRGELVPWESAAALLLARKEPA